MIIIIDYIEAIYINTLAALTNYVVCIELSNFMFNKQSNTFIEVYGREQCLMSDLAKNYACNENQKSFTITDIDARNNKMSNLNVW